MTKKITIERELLQRALQYCTDGKTSKEIKNILFQADLENYDFNMLADGINLTTILPIRRHY